MMVRRAFCIATTGLCLAASLSGHAMARPEASANCAIPTIDDHCESWTSVQRGAAAPADVVAAGSVVYSIDRAWQLRASQADTGTLVWDVRLIASPGAISSSLAIAPDGSALYAQGLDRGRPTLIRVAPATGAIVWTSAIQDPRVSSARLGVTADGTRVVVTGFGTGERIVVVVFDASTGMELGRGASDVEGSEWAYSQAISPDGSKVFAIGDVWDESSEDTDGLVVAFEIGDPNRLGEQAWASTLDLDPGYDTLYEGAVSPDGRTIYATGSSDSTRGPIGLGYPADMTVVAFSTSDGHRRWATSHRGSPGFNEGLDVAVSPSGDRVYVAGNYSTTGKDDELDAALLALAPENGEEIWTAVYGGPGVEDERFFEVAVSPDGMTVYATGKSGVSLSSSGTSAWVSDVVTTALSRSGTQLWSARYRDSANQGSYDYGFGLALSPGGRVHVLAGLQARRSSTQAPALNSFRFDGAILTYAS